MSDLARLLQQYGYGQPNALAQDGESFDTSNVLAGMPRPSALSSALQTAGVPPQDEHGFLFSNVGGELKFNPYEAIKNFMGYRAPPGALSTSGDDAPVRNSLEAAGWLGASGLGMAPKNAVGSAGGWVPKGLPEAAATPRAASTLDQRLQSLTPEQVFAVAKQFGSKIPDGADAELVRRYIHQEVLRQVHAAAKSLSARTASPVPGMGRVQQPGELAATNKAARAKAEAQANAAIDGVLGQGPRNQ